MPAIKQGLLASMLNTLHERIESAQKAIDSAIDSRNTATKSSAGDKHETGRALMQTEIDNQNKQLANSILLKNTLSQIPLAKSSKVDFGSLVETNHGFFYISVSIGIVQFAGNEYFTLSPATPLARVLTGAVAGDTIAFQGRQYQILNIS